MSFLSGMGMFRASWDTIRRVLVSCRAKYRRRRARRCRQQQFPPLITSYKHVGTSRQPLLLARHPRVGTSPEVAGASAKLPPAGNRRLNRVLPRINPHKRELKIPR
jgi:hypothetical protein